MLMLMRMLMLILTGIMLGLRYYSLEISASLRQWERQRGRRSHDLFLFRSLCAGGAMFL